MYLSHSSVVIQLRNLTLSMLLGAVMLMQLLGLAGWFLLTMSGVAPGVAMLSFSLVAIVAISIILIPALVAVSGRMRDDFDKSHVAGFIMALSLIAFVQLLWGIINAANAAVVAPSRELVIARAIIIVAVLAFSFITIFVATVATTAFDKTGPDLLVGRWVFFVAAIISSATVAAVRELAIVCAILEVVAAVMLTLSVHGAQANSQLLPPAPTTPPAGDVDAAGSIADPVGMSVAKQPDKSEGAPALKLVS